MNAATIFGSRQNQSNILGRRERERERETMKNNGGERYFYLKKGKKFLRECVPREIETRREFSILSLSRSLPARYSIMVDRCKDTQRRDNYIRAGQCPKKGKEKKKRNCHLLRINNSRFAYGVGERGVSTQGRTR